MNIERYIRISKSLLYKAEENQKHFSFIITGSKILAIGINTFQEHPKGHYFGFKWGGLHSEISAILKLGKPFGDNCKKYDIINIRLNKKGLVRISKPCKTCENVLKMIDFKRAYYSTNDSNTAQCIKFK